MGVAGFVHRLRFPHTLADIIIFSANLFQRRPLLVSNQASHQFNKARTRSMRWCPPPATNNSFATLLSGFLRLTIVAIIDRDLRVAVRLSYLPIIGNIEWYDCRVIRQDFDMSRRSSDAFCHTHPKSVLLPFSRCYMLTRN